MKIAFVFALVCTIVWVPEGAFGLLFALAAVVSVLGLVLNVSFKALLKKLLLLEPFILSVALLAAFGPGGVKHAAFLLMKGSVSLSALLIFAQSVPFGEMLQTLKALRMPALLITTIALMHRYLFVLSDESMRMRRARASRTFAKGRAFEWSVISTIASRLFIRGQDRAERIYGAMCARGWDASSD